MNLMEYQGKELFKRSGIAVPRGYHARTPEDVGAFLAETTDGWVVKAQVLMGGRGKAGKIKMATGATEDAALPKRSWRPRCLRIDRTHKANRSARCS